VAEADGVDDLYRAHPGDFVTARDRLAKELRVGGDREAAAAVKKLRRPTVVAWAVNQVVRTHGEAVEELVEATAGVQQAQAAALAGAGAGDARSRLRHAVQRRRRLVATLAEAAADLAGSAHHDQAAATIDAASLDPDATTSFRRGRLSRELAPPAGFGFGAEPGVDPGTGPGASDEGGESGDAAPSPADEPPPPAPPPIDLAPLRREADRAEAAVTAAEEDLQRAEEALARATARVEVAQDDLDLAVGDRDRARAALADAAPG
jgi:hypothetical protein